MSRFILAVLLLAAVSAQAAPVLLTPSTRYAGFADSPFKDFGFSEYFYLEDFEDSYLNTPGVRSVGAAWGPNPQSDSVDPGGVAWRNSARAPVVGTPFNFSLGDLPVLPTHVGVALTDALAPLDTATFRVEILDELNTRYAFDHMPVVSSPLDPSPDDDRFIGVIHDVGIVSFNIQIHRPPPASGIGVELDHLQYGAGATASAAPVPEPSTLVLLGSGLVGLLAYKRRD